MRSRLAIPLLVLLLFYCEQVPTTLDDTAFIDNSSEDAFTLQISTFDFDMLSWDFFFSIRATSPSDSIQIQVDLLSSNVLIESFVLNDLGQGDDIQSQDGSFDGIWTLPAEMSNLIGRVWSIEVTGISNGETQTASVSLRPQLSIKPVITGVDHADTLSLPVSGMLIDTLHLHLEHSGRDLVKTVTLLSQKPDGNYANGSQPIQLYDDGGTQVFGTINGIDFTSGDKTAGDGIFSLLLPLISTDLVGTYLWTFEARTWAGIEAKAFLDTLVVIPANSGLGSENTGNILQ